MKYFFISLFILSFNFTLAQQQFNYGLKIGMNLSSPKTEITNFYYSEMYRDSRLGNSIALFSEYSFNEFIKFQLEISYSNEGAEDKIPITTFEKPDGTGEFYVIDHQYDYFNSKLLFEPGLINESFDLYGIFGPSLKILVAKKDVMSYSLDSKKVVLGYSVGAGLLPKKILGEKVFIEFIFNDTFGNLISTRDFKLKFTSLQLNLGCNVN